jgi:predicted nuclease of predicted toxin-antitoxin system
VKLLADENIDKPIVDRLRQDGHVVLYILEMDPGISDGEVIQQANQENALLLTADKDFGELVFRQGRMTQGVVLIRLSGLSPQQKAELVVKAIQDHEAEMAQHFTVITPGMVRIRKQPA